MAQVRFDGTDVYVGGHLSADTMDVSANAVTNASVSATAAIARSKLEKNALRAFVVPFMDWRIWDAFQSLLPATSASDDLGLYTATFGSAAPLIRTYDVKAAGAVTLRMRTLIALPAEYDGGQAISIRLKAGMVTTVADVSATIDVEAYKVNEEGGIGSDLCATSAQSINSLTFANKDFTITPTGLSVGDILDVRVSIAVNDAATATAVIAAIGATKLLCDIRG